MLVNRKYTVQTIAIIVWIVFLSASGSQKKFVFDEMRALQLEMSMPILGPGDTIQNRIFHEIRYEMGDIFIHAFPTTHSQSDITLNREGDIIKDSLIAIWDKHKYLVFENMAAKGILFDSLDANTGRLISIDSMMGLNTITSSSKFINQIIQKDRLIKTWKNGDEIVETYIPKIKKDISYSDSLVLVFSKKLNDFRFSLSDSLDKAKGIKLSQMRLIYNGNPALGDPYASKPRKLVMKIEEIPVTNNSELLRLIDKFRKESADKKIQ